MNFDASKNLSGVGALLLFISPLILSIAIPGGGVLVALVGLILMLIGIKGLADYYGEAGIFNNMLYGTIAGIVGVVVAIGVSIGVVLSSLSSFMYKIFPNWNGVWTALPNMTPNPANITFGDVIPFLVAGLAVFVILFVSAIIIALFYRRSFSLLKNKSGIGLFGAIAIVWLIGAILTIILIGYLLVWVAVLLLAIAFFELRSQATQSVPPAQAAAPPQPIV